MTCDIQVSCIDSWTLQHLSTMNWNAFVMHFEVKICWFDDYLPLDVDSIISRFKFLEGAYVVHIFKMTSFDNFFHSNILCCFFLRSFSLLKNTQSKMYYIWTSNWYNFTKGSNRPTNPWYFSGFTPAKRCVHTHDDYYSESNGIQHIWKETNNNHHHIPQKKIWK